MNTHPTTRHDTSCTGMQLDKEDDPMPTSHTPKFRPMSWAERQAKAWADDNLRTQVAKKMYTHKFGNNINTKGKTLARLQEMARDRLRQYYHVLAKEHGVKQSNRTYNPHRWNTENPVHQALTSANAFLHATTRAAISELGCSTSLGFIHTEQEDAFTYDIADLYKAELTIPLAFSLKDSRDPAKTAVKLLAESTHQQNLRSRIVDDIKNIVTIEIHTPT